MYFKTFADFIAMGGYGLFVWGSFGVTALVMLAEIVASRRQHAAIAQEISEELNI
jgi:heme exporter protein D